MKKLLSFTLALFIIQLIQAQEPLTLVKAISLENACHKRAAESWMGHYKEKIFGQNYINALNSNDEFKLNKYNKTMADTLEKALRSIKLNNIYYVTELIDNYSYDFSKFAVNIDWGETNKPGSLDAYIEGGLRKNWITKTWESNWNPEFTISNSGNIPESFEMPEDIAEKSFAQRKGTAANRPAFRLRYYFRIWNCDTKFFLNSANPDRHFDVEVIKVELIDDIVNYNKSYEVELGLQPVKPNEEQGTTEASNTDPTKTQSENSEPNNSGQENTKNESNSTSNNNNSILISEITNEKANSYIVKSVILKNSGGEASDLIILLSYKDGPNDNLKTSTKEYIVQWFKNLLEDKLKGEVSNLSKIKSDSLFKIELTFTARLEGTTRPDAFLNTRVYITKNGNKLRDNSFERSRSLLLLSNDPYDVLGNAMTNSLKKLSKILSEYIQLE